MLPLLGLKSVFNSMKAQAQWPPAQHTRGPKTLKQQPLQQLLSLALTLDPQQYDFPFFFSATGSVI